MCTNYVLCAAGQGTRFQKYFENVPKALIRLNGRTLLEWSIASLPLFANDTLIIITQAKHNIREKIGRCISKLYPFVHLHWLELEHTTRGQLETAFSAHKYLDNSASLCIYNCDTYFESHTLLTLMHNKEIDAIIPCAQAQGTAWSFCKVDANNNVLDIKEKERISSWATVGMYYFRDTQKFLQYAHDALQIPAQNNGEYYVAPLYGRYIADGATILMDKVSLFKPMGTPEQIETFWNCSLESVKMENLAPVLVIDLDNTITIEDCNDSYANKKPNMPVIEKMRACAAKGYEIIIYSSRRMQTHNNEEAKVVADIAYITIEWLKQYNVPYHGLKFGKPYARNGYYVDDKAIRPDEFIQLMSSDI